MANYGSTLTDLQAGINAARGLQIQRDNEKDRLSQQQLEAFLRLQGQKYQTQAQQNALAADRAMRFAELAQQNQQFGTRESNLMKLGELEAKTRENVANATRGGLDYRSVPAILEADQYNKEGQARVVEASRLSQEAQEAMDEIKAANDYHYLWWNGGAYEPFKQKYGREPNLKQATENLKRIRDRAAELKLTPTSRGGFDAPPFAPLQIPTIGRSGQSVEPAPPAAVQPRVPAMFQGGDVTIGGVPLNNFIDSAPVVDALAPSTVAPPVSRYRWTPNGVVAY